MFVRNRASIDFKYRKSDYLVVLKANTVTYVDENKVSAKELRGCYGQRIEIISRDIAEDIATPHTVEEAIKKEAPKATKIIKKEELNDSFIEKVLEEIEGEVKKEETSTPEIKEDKTCEEVAQQVVAFLSGGTDKLVEGKVIKGEDSNKEKEPKPAKTTKTKTASKTRGFLKNKK